MKRPKTIEPTTREIEQALRCSHCKHLKLQEHFSMRPSGILYKTCNKCRHNYKCEQCEDKFFKSKRDLKRHTKAVHDKIRDYSCEECSSSFSAKCKLKRHIKMVHLKIRDHKCTNCRYASSLRADLRSHIKRCTGPNYTPMSGLEMRCKEALTDLGFEEDKDYIYDHTFSKLTDWCGKRLRPDFRFINHKIMIECDGSQHFKVKQFGSSREEAERRFEIIKENDKIKDSFCDTFGYKMIRIPYWDIMKMKEILSVELNDIIEK